MSEPNGTENNPDKESFKIEEVDFLPGITPTVGGLTGAIELIEQSGIVSAYRRWINKSEPKGGRSESIMISCPMPGHKDEHPSAWMNSDKNLWNCGACGIGGDIIDLAAIAHGAPFPSYRTPGNPEFTRVLEAALVDCGYDPDVLRAENANRTVEKESHQESSPGQEIETQICTSENDHSVELLARLEESELDWQKITKTAPNSFLDMWMEATHQTDLPNEYLFWTGLQMVGLAVGRDCTLGEGSEVFPNLLLVLLGETGAGKTRTIRLAGKVLYEALPFDPKDASSKGVANLNKPGSGEALYEMFSWIPENETEPHPLRGMIEFSEMKEVMSSAGRRGSTLREAIIEIADSPTSVGHSTRTSGSMTVKEPFMAMTVGGQPDAMGDILDKNDMSSGFANRFVYVPATMKGRVGWHDRHVPDLTGLADKLATVRSWASRHKASRHHGVIEMDMMAAQEFDEMCAWFDEMRKRPDGDLYARLELHAMKLILILCANQRTDMADKTIIQQVHHLIQSTLKAMGEVSEGLTMTRNEYYRTHVMRVIEKSRAERSKPPTRSDINRGLSSKRRDPFAVGVAIKELERTGLIMATPFIVETGPNQPNRTIDRWHFTDEEKWWHGTS